MTTRIALFVLALSLCSCLAIAQGNLVVNGGFDTDASGWTTNGSSGYCESLKGNPGGCFDLYGSISQTVNSLTPSFSYLVSGSYDVAGGTLGSTPSFGVAMNGVFLFEVTPPDYAWHSFSFTYTANNSSVVLSLTAGVYGTSDVFRIDNISMGAVPEPSGLSLFGVGILLLLWRGTRPNKSLQATPRAPGFRFAVTPSACAAVVPAPLGRSWYGVPELWTLGDFARRETLCHYYSWLFHTSSQAASCGLSRLRPLHSVVRLLCLRRFLLFSSWVFAVQRRAIG